MTSLLSLLFILTLLCFILLLFFLLAFKYYFDFSLKNEIFFIQTTIFIITMSITIIIISHFSICFYFLKMKISSFDINCNYLLFFELFLFALFDFETFIGFIMFILCEIFLFVFIITSFMLSKYFNYKGFLWNQ